MRQVTIRMSIFLIPFHEPLDKESLPSSYGTSECGMWARERRKEGKDPSFPHGVNCSPWMLKSLCEEESVPVPVLPELQNSSKLLLFWEAPLSSLSVLNGSHLSLCFTILISLDSLMPFQTTPLRGLGVSHLSYHTSHMTSEGSPQREGEAPLQAWCKVRTRSKVQQWCGRGPPRARERFCLEGLPAEGRDSGPSYITFLDLSFFNHKIGDRPLQHGTLWGEGTDSKKAQVHPSKPRAGMLRAHLCQDKARKKNST